MNENQTLIYRNGVCHRGQRNGEPRRLPNIEGRGIPWLTSDEQVVPFTAKRLLTMEEVAWQSEQIKKVKDAGLQEALRETTPARLRELLGSPPQFQNACMDGDLL